MFRYRKLVHEKIGYTMSEKKNKRVDFGVDVIRTYDVDGVPSETVEHVHTVDGTYPRGILKGVVEHEVEHANMYVDDGGQVVELTDDERDDDDDASTYRRRVVKVIRQEPPPPPPPLVAIPSQPRAADDLGNFDLGVGKYRIRWLPTTDDDRHVQEEQPVLYDDVVKRRTWRILTDLDDDDDGQTGSKNSLDLVLAAQSSGHRRPRPFDSPRYHEAANVRPFTSNSVKYVEDDAYGRRRVDYSSRTSRYTDHELNEILRAIG